MAMSAWCEPHEVINFLSTKYPSLRFYFLAEEPGMDYFATNDVSGKYFPERYYLSGFDDCEPCYYEEHELQGFLEDVSELVGRHIDTIDDAKKAVRDYNESVTNHCYAEIRVYQIVNMRFQDYEFNGTTYKCRIVTDKDGNDLVIASTKFLDALQPGSFDDENEGFASKEAEDIYDEIFFFTDGSSLRLTDEQLVEVLKEDNEEWFN